MCAKVLALAVMECNTSFRARSSSGGIPLFSYSPFVTCPLQRTAVRKKNHLSNCLEGKEAGAAFVAPTLHWTFLGRSACRFRSVHPRMPAALVGEDGEVMACTYVPRSQRAAAAAASRSAADEECRE